MKVCVAIRKDATFSQDEMDDRARTQYTAQCYIEKICPLQISHRMVRCLEYDIPDLTQVECKVFCTRVQNYLTQLASEELKKIVPVVLFVTIQAPRAPRQQNYWISEQGFRYLCNSLEVQHAIIKNSNDETVLSKIKKMVDDCYQLTRLDRAYIRGTMIGFFASSSYDFPSELAAHVGSFLERKDAASVVQTCSLAQATAKTEEETFKKFQF